MGEKVLNIGSELKGLEVAARVKSLKAVRRALDDLKHGLEVVEKCKDKVGSRGVQFLSFAGSEVGLVESEMSDCESKVGGLCSFFAEDAKVCEASEIIGVLIQFNRLVATSLEAFRRRKRRAEIDAAREQNRKAASGGPSSSPPHQGQFTSARGRTNQPSAPPPSRAPPLPQGQDAGRRSSANQFNQDLLKQALAERR